MLSNSYIRSIAIVLVALLCMTVFVQHSRNGLLKEKLNRSNDSLNLAQSSMQDMQKTINEMQAQNKKMADLYVKQQKEYESAQAKIIDLERDLADGTKRLRINATCDSEPMSAKSSPTGVDDGRTAKLTRDAERNYIRLRKQIVSVTSQVNGLRSYINSLPIECVAR
ncbi:MAG: lysis protein [Vibrio sp.]